MILMVIPAAAAALISLRDVKQQRGINGEGKAAAGRARGPFACHESRHRNHHQRATHSPGDPAGHGAFTYMVMYSVRAQSSRYIGLSRSSDTMPHRTTKCSFPVFPLRSHSFPLTAFLYLLLLLLPLLVLNLILLLSVTIRAPSPAVI